jgi:hypothetical protein
VSRRGARAHVGGNTRTSPNPGRAASGLVEECRHLELSLSMTELASFEVSLPPFQESGNALNHSKKPFAGVFGGTPRQRCQDCCQRWML